MEADGSLPPPAASSPKEDLVHLAGRDDLVLTYHSVTNRKLHGFDSGGRSDYGMMPFAYSGWAATMRYDFNQDRGEYVTQIRIDPNCKQMLIVRGGGGGFGHNLANCSNGLVISPEGS